MWRALIWTASWKAAVGRAWVVLAAFARPVASGRPEKIFNFGFDNGIGCVKVRAKNNFERL
jgi:hypothetical protein